MRTCIVEDYQCPVAQFAALYQGVGFHKPTIARVYECHIEWLSGIGIDEFQCITLNKVYEMRQGVSINLRLCFKARIAIHRSKLSNPVPTHRVSNCECSHSSERASFNGALRLHSHNQRVNQIQEFILCRS